MKGFVVGDRVQIALPKMLRDEDNCWGAFGRIIEIRDDIHIVKLDSGRRVPRSSGMIRMTCNHCGATVEVQRLADGSRLLVDAESGDLGGTYDFCPSSADNRHHAA